MPLPRRIALALLLGVFVVLGAFLTPSVALAVQPPLFSLRLVAQPLEFDGGAAVLDGLWQFHLGDNLAWAAPSFDDSGWEQLKADKPWGQQGHPNRDGFGWYRLHVTLAPGRSPDELALLVPAVEDAYEVYWNGRLLGTYG